MCRARPAGVLPDPGRLGLPRLWEDWLGSLLEKVRMGGKVEPALPCPQQSWRLGAGVAEVRTRRVPSGASELAPIPQTWPAAAGAQRRAVSISALCSRAASSWALVSPDPHPHPPRVPAAQQAALARLVRSLSAGDGGAGPRGSAGSPGLGRG